MVSCPRRIAGVPRSVRSVLVRSVLVLFLLTACSGGGGRGADGAAGVGDPYFPKAGNGGYDVSHYDLTLAYDPKGRPALSGSAAITARAAQDLDSFHLDLRGLSVEEVTVEGARADWSRSGQELSVRPAHALDKGETFRVTVAYSGTPRPITDPDGSREGWLRTADGALALGEPVGSMAWFPGNHHPSDKATYDITVTVPKDLTAVSNGEPTAERTADGRTTSTWHIAEPMASYLATLAIGRYTVTRSTTEDDLPVYVAVDPTQVSASREVLARLPEIMDWAQNNFGPYPFSSTGAIVDRPEDSRYALETQNRPVFPGPPDTATLVHEIAHQWFGDSVTPRTWRDMWLNESFATYAEWLWEEDEGGATAEETFTDLYENGEEDYPGLWDFPPGDPPTAADISSDPVYQRGAMVVHRIRRTVGDDTFYDIVQGWTAAHRHGTADTDDFTAYVERQAPDQDFDEIWDDWLHGEGKPELP
ncbi:M1 family metallopeptidase [Streptomyces sp. NBC_00582]|uniref:M1 family metallopeptidase n=1 Tax=Streptomyces sp. NBC_00582 TaxID=2975783 RepID=UPI002E80844F|nr:M1 family metallopeptidase [Streptomyces sp. NBC_00582]WUB68045.1 M1 family metallopeptidase [Streptomyces sp. NBC_00582]